jgi:DNA-binding protein YbaB
VTASSPEDRFAQLERAIDEYPDRVERLRRNMAEAAAQTVTGVAGDGQVVVALTGQGSIQGVRVTHRALRELDRRSLANRVIEAVNDGLDRADALLAAEAGDSAGDAEAEAALASFERRMDDLFYELDYLDRKLDRLDD